MFDLLSNLAHCRQNTGRCQAHLGISGKLHRGWRESSGLGCVFITLFQNRTTLMGFLHDKSHCFALPSALFADSSISVIAVETQECSKVCQAQHRHTARLMQWKALTLGLSVIHIIALLGQERHLSWGWGLSASGFGRLLQPSLVLALSRRWDITTFCELTAVKGNSLLHYKTG